jgi:hypothetical protein
MYFYPLLLSLVQVNFARSVLPEQLNSDALQNKVAKINAIKTPLYVPDPFDYVRTMIKYDIQPTLPGALSYNEIISTRPGLGRRSDPLGFTNAHATPGPVYAGYRSPVIIGEGEDAKTFFIMFDTGSSDFWVFSTLMGAEDLEILNNTRVLYDPFNSTTAIPTGQTLDASYFSTTGPFTDAIGFNDTLTIGGLTIKNQTIGAAVAADVNGTLDYDQLPMDGIMGLSLLGNNRMLPGPARDVLANLFFDGPESPASGVFTASLTRTTEPDGFFTFGYIDDDLVGNSTITYIPVPPGSWAWAVPSQYIIINGNRTERLPTAREPTPTAMIDSGTNQILLSDDVLPLIYEPLGGMFNTTLQAWVFPANYTPAQLPTIVLPAGDNDVTIALEDIIYTPADENWIVGSIQSRGSYPIDLFGDFWMRNVYAIFDLGNGTKDTFRFGFVPRAPVQQYISAIES